MFDTLPYNYLQTQNGIVLVFGELPGKATVRDVVQVLQPLEVRDGDTTSIQVQVGNDEALLVKEDLVSGGRHRAVGTLGDDFRLSLLVRSVHTSFSYIP